MIDNQMKVIVGGITFLLLLSIIIGFFAEIMYATFFFVGGGWIIHKFNSFLTDGG